MHFRSHAHSDEKSKFGSFIFNMFGEGKERGVENRQVMFVMN